MCQSTMNFYNKPYSIVGVMPASFRFPHDLDVWVPLAIDPVRETKGDFFSFVEVVGRLKPGASHAAAQTELFSISQQAVEGVNGPSPVAKVEVVPLHQQLVSGVRLTVLILWGAVALVMLIACVNVASLMISRT